MADSSIPSLPPLTTAAPSHASSIAALRDDLARWMIANGIRQWQPGEITADEVAAQITDGEWHVAEVDGRLAACYRLIWSDPLFWGDDDAPAGYIHGLMVDRRYAGARWGAQLVESAAQRTAAAGYEVLRLDAAASNPTLLAFYRSLGFVDVRLADLPAHFNSDIKIMLFERVLGQIRT